jgi:hypothetical protein
MAKPKEKKKLSPRPPKAKVVSSNLAGRTNRNLPKFPETIIVPADYERVPALGESGDLARGYWVFRKKPNKTA